MNLWLFSLIPVFIFNLDMYLKIYIQNVIIQEYILYKTYIYICVAAVNELERQQGSVDGRA